MLKAGLEAAEAPEARLDASRVPEAGLEGEEAPEAELAASVEFFFGEDLPIFIRDLFGLAPHGHAERVHLMAALFDNHKF